MKNRNQLNLVFCAATTATFIADYKFDQDVFTVYFGIAAVTVIIMSVREALQNMAAVQDGKPE